MPGFDPTQFAEPSGVIATPDDFYVELRLRVDSWATAGVWEVRDSTEVLQLQATNNDPSISVIFGNVGGGWETYTFAATLGVEYALRLDFNGSARALFLDGVAVATSSDDAGAPSVPLRFGGRQDSLVVTRLEIGHAP